MVMADVSFVCPECRQPLEAPEEMAGEQVACPACNAELTVPVGPAEDAGADPQEQTACPECGTALASGAVLCIGCGYHLKLGRRIETELG